MASIFLLATLLSSIASYLVIMCVHLLSLCAFVSLTLDIAGYAALVLPSVQGVYAIHRPVVLASIPEVQTGLIGLGYSYVYLAVLLFILVIALWTRFAKRDFF